MVGSNFMRGVWWCRVAVACLLAMVAATGCSTNPSGGIDDVLGAPKLEQPRLWTGEQAPKTFWLNVDQFNGGSQIIGGTRVDYIGQLNSDLSYPGSPAELAEIEVIRQVGAKQTDFSGTVSLNFDNDSLDYVLQQLLGGMLGINYLTPGPLSATVTFRTEAPIARSQALAVVRSLLAQHGMSIKVVSGIMHVGTPGQIAEIEAITGQGRPANAVTRVVGFPGGIDPSLAESLTAILPAGAAVTMAPDGRNLILHASADAVDSVENLIRSFATNGGGRDFYAIIHLQHSAPDAMAEQLQNFFASQTLRGEAAPRSIIPLENRQALLVSASSRTAIENVRRVVSQLDFQMEDPVTLRIIPLRHASAGLLAEQLGAMFGSEPSPPAGEEASAGADASAARQQAGATDAEPSSGPRLTLSRTPKMSIGEDPPFAEGPDTSFHTLKVTGGDPAGGGDRVQQAFEDQQRTAAAVPVHGDQSVSIAADERNNALLVRSNYQQFKRIREAVAVLDVPLGQVIIEATILEVKITDQLRYGVQWFLSGSGFSVRSSSGTAVDGSSLNGLVTSVEELVSGISIEAVIDALDDVTEVRVVSSPYLTVMDRKTARLVVGDQIPFATKSQTSTNIGDTTTSTVQEIEVRDTGVILEVTPVIRADNSVELTIQQEVSSAELASGAGSLTPTVATRSITSDVIVSSGRTILLGGLIQDRKDDIRTGVPGLRKAPLIGKLFEQTSQADIRTEVVILITPRVSRKPSELERISDQLRRQLGLSGGFPGTPLPAAGEWQE